MELLIALAVIAFIVVFYFISAQSKSPHGTKPAEMTRRRHMDDELSWLRERWKLADIHRESGNETMFPQWYFDDVTERQLAKLKELGIETGKEVTKGQASDLIGLYEPVEERNLAILKFFKKPTKGMNQIRARHEVAHILSVPENAKAWAMRPPTQEQKEFFNFFGIKLDKGLTATQADKLIVAHTNTLAENNEPRLEEWEAFSDILDQLSDADFRADYEIKKPTVATLKQALDELGKSGTSYRDAANDIELVLDKLVELKPDLRRE